ncbi:MAG: isoprenyl transferase [Endomicrobia bacterium]|nr:isoprenyl transferase [Endomicrobiia bacterium]
MEYFGIFLDEKKLPNHVAIIMDGNGRWAQKRGLPRIFGHRAGANTVRRVVEIASKLGIKYLSLYAFSTENWIRPEKEIKSLFNLLRYYVKKEGQNLQKNNIRLIVSGDISKLDDTTQQSLMELKEKLRLNTGLTLNLCINYSGRHEIINAVNKILKSGIQKITEETFEKYLYTCGLPDVDLLIRTSGEIRISNFMLWKLAYTEMYFTKTLWPDFTSKEFILAVKEFQNRERRFGGIFKKT